MKYNNIFPFCKMMKSLVCIIITLVHKLIDYKRMQSIKNIFSWVYFMWLKAEFGRIGEKCFIGRGALIIGGKNIYIGDRTNIGGNATITAWIRYHGQIFHPEISIGEGCSIGEYCHISAIDTIIIGNNVLTGRWLTIVDNAHGNSSRAQLEIAPSLRPIYSKGPVVIEDNVWIGDKVTILAGVTVGKGAIIGANSVVAKDVLPYSVVGGIPATVIKKL